MAADTENDARQDSAKPVSTRREVGPVPTLHIVKSAFITDCPASLKLKLSFYSLLADADSKTIGKTQ
ncbi:hypothetical protein [Thiomicrospira sp. XS5]|uniref:hypothetical protein n=1 Tax=Thiomicrospira sp. XS5 TaxID=1775636 RepID=UPI0009E9FDDB|nr:hypothetical protein [Thiomicrospira sp. XS5]